MTATINPISLILRSHYWRSRKLPPEILTAPRLVSALASIDERWPEQETGHGDAERPVFILSAGWGSGSTLLQRLVVSGGQCMMWGEPIDHAAPVHRLAQMIMPVSTTWPRPASFELPDGTQGFANSWIANLTPEVENFRAAHRELLARWLAVPARNLGYEYWGMKEVRLTVEHACYLRWLFPNARFLFIYRDVMNAFRSCKGTNWLSVWPDYKVDDASYFAHHWRFLLEGFLDGSAALGGMLVQYEQLISGGIAVKQIADYLDIGELDAGVLQKKVGSRSKNRPALGLIDRFKINSITGELRERVGYSG